MMRIQLEPSLHLADYEQVSCAFDVLTELDVDALESRGQIIVREVLAPYIKDYDVIPDNRPTNWPAQHDTNTWQMFSAFDGDHRVGGALVIPQSPFTKRVATAELWDLRVASHMRGRGIGLRLFNAVEHWCRENLRTSLLIETQHNNVGACRFYQKRGCVVDSITREAYPSAPHETRIVWRLDLTVDARSS